jgi:hypothetical protein
LLGNFELNRSGGFLLNYRRSITHSAAGTQVIDVQPDEVTAPGLAVDGEVEQSQVTPAVLLPEPDT